MAVLGQTPPHAAIAPIAGFLDATLDGDEVSGCVQELSSLVMFRCKYPNDVGPFLLPLAQSQSRRGISISRKPTAFPLYVQSNRWGGIIEAEHAGLWLTDAGPILGVNIKSSQQGEMVSWQELFR